jgi:hypothetical protein
MRTVLLVCAAALLSCAGLSVVVARTAQPAEAAERDRAEAQWATRTFSRYQLLLSDKRCLQSIEVRDERVVEVAPNRCEPPPRTITDLFTLIRRDGSVSIPCIALGCACDDVIRVRATYDATLGFPKTIEVRMSAQPNWRHPDYWERLVQRRALPDCTVLPEGSKVIRVMSVTPLP